MKQTFRIAARLAVTDTDLAQRHTAKLVEGSKSELVRMLAHKLAAEMYEIVNEAAVFSSNHSTYSFERELSATLFVTIDTQDLRPGIVAPFSENPPYI